MEILRKLKYLILPSLFAVFLSFSGRVILSGLESEPVCQASVLRITPPEEGPVLYFGHNDGRVPVVTFHILPFFEENPTGYLLYTSGLKPAACHTLHGITGGSGISILRHICKLQV